MKRKQHKAPQPEAAEGTALPACAETASAQTTTGELVAQSTPQSALVPSDANEAAALGQFMAEAFGRAVRYQMQHGHKSRQQAEAEVLAPTTDAHTRLAMQRAPQQVTYLDMVKLQARDPQLAAERWESVRKHARDSWWSGECHARALSQTDEEYLWQFANFIAVRDSLAIGCEPRNGLELELINQMAQAQMNWMKWMQILTERTNRDFVEESGLIKKIRAPELEQAQAIEQAAAMVERFQRLFLRAQRAFQDSRKLPSVVVQNAGQVNVAQQQVNINESA